MLWASSTLLSAALYIVLLTVLGQGSIFQLVPAITLASAGAIASSMNPRSYTGFMPGLQERVRKAVEEAGLYINPYERARTAAYHLKILIMASAGYLASAIATHLFFTLPLPLVAASIIPLAVPPFVGVYLGTFDKVKERRDRAERELPFFSTLAAILSRAGLTIYSAMVRASSRADIFPWMSREAKGVKRDVEALGIGVTESIVNIFSKHPSHRLRTLMLTVTSIWRTGGDVTGTLEAFASQHLKELGDRWDQYGRSVSGLAEMLTIIFLIFPMSVGIIAIAFPHYSTGTLALQAVALTPILAVMCYMLIRGMSPAMPDRYSLPAGRLAAALTPLAIPAAAVTPSAPPPSILAGLGCLASSILVYVVMKNQIEEVSQCERALPSFIRDVAELRRVGYTIMQSLEKCIDNPYPARFRELLRRAVARMKMGVEVSDSVRDARSWLVRMTFTLLEEVEESGGGSPELLEKVENLVRTYLYNKDRARSSVKMYTYMIAGIPLIISFASALIVGLSAVMAPLSGQSFGGISLTIARPSDVKSVMDLTMITTLESSAVMAILVGRAADQHPFSTWRVAVASAAFTLSAALFPQMTDVAMRALGISGGGW